MKQPTAPVLVIGAALLLGSLSTSARAATIILHKFSGGSNDGAYPDGSVTLAGSTLYGMTHGGGSTGSGAIFSMNGDGSGYHLLHSFQGGFADGSTPYGALTVSGSQLFGMTTAGGHDGSGTIFSLNSDGSGYHLLHSFTRASVADGAGPFGSLTVSGSKLYGLTSAGGSRNSGTIFSMNRDGSGFSLLHSFLGGSGGYNPIGSLTLSGSTLYGMAQLGASAGMLFSVNLDGSGFFLLHNFSGGAGDGANPQGSLTLADSQLYGMTTLGGSRDDGTIFSMNTDGTGFRLLHSFAGGASDGFSPKGSLTLSGSRLYGLTQLGGTSNGSTLFEIRIDGSGYKLLESFDGGPAEGAQPYYSDLALSGDGSTLYGMTSRGGSADAGVVFSRAIPEPGAFGLLSLGAFLLSARRRNWRWLFLQLPEQCSGQPRACAPSGYRLILPFRLARELASLCR